MEDWITSSTSRWSFLRDGHSALAPRIILPAVHGLCGPANTAHCDALAQVGLRLRAHRETILIHRWHSRNYSMRGRANYHESHCSTRRVPSNLRSAHRICASCSLRHVPVVVTIACVYHSYHPCHRPPILSSLVHHSHLTRLSSKPEESKLCTIRHHIHDRARLS